MQKPTVRQKDACNSIEVLFRYATNLSPRFLHTQRALLKVSVLTRASTTDTPQMPKCLIRLLGRSVERREKGNFCIMTPLGEFLCHVMQDSGKREGGWIYFDGGRGIELRERGLVWL